MWHFQGLAGKTVTLTVSSMTIEDGRQGPAGGDQATGFGRRSKSAIPRNGLRKTANMVEEKSGGKIGYIFVTNTGIPGTE